MPLVPIQDPLDPPEKEPPPKPAAAEDAAAPKYPTSYRYPLMYHWGWFNP